MFYSRENDNDYNDPIYIIYVYKIIKYSLGNIII